MGTVPRPNGPAVDSSHFCDQQAVGSSSASCVRRLLRSSHANSPCRHSKYRTAGPLQADRPPPRTDASGRCCVPSVARATSRRFAEPAIYVQDRYLPASSRLQGDPGLSRGKTPGHRPARACPCCPCPFPQFSPFFPSACLWKRPKKMWPVCNTNFCLVFYKNRCSLWGKLGK